jgi:hypothetical protein
LLAKQFVVAGISTFEYERDRPPGDPPHETGSLDEFWLVDVRVSHSAVTASVQFDETVAVPVDQLHDQLHDQVHAACVEGVTGVEAQSSVGHGCKYLVEVGDTLPE